MPTAEIIAIGTELLLGEIQDSNTRYLARFFRNINVDLFRSTMIGDNSHRISELIKEALSRSDIVITSGGLGPTVDDPTRQAVANALGVELVYRPDLWAQIEDRFQRFGRAPSENNRRQAYIPDKAIPVENQVGTAPSFICEIDQKCIISLPGVPRELEYLCQNAILPYLLNRYKTSGLIKVRVLHTAGLGESLVDEKVADLELLTNPTVGLLAHPGQTDIRITAKADSIEEADGMIKEIEDTIVNRLGSFIYGSDDEKLGIAIQNLLTNNHLEIHMIENGFKGELQNLFSILGFNSGELLSNPSLTMEEIANFKTADNLQNDNLISMWMVLTYQEKKSTLDLLVSHKDCTEIKHFASGGPLENAPIWAVNTSLYSLYHFLINL